MIKRFLISTQRGQIAHKDGGKIVLRQEAGVCKKCEIGLL